MKQRRVLIVDDDAAVSRVLVRVFERAGCIAAAAPNGKRALALLSSDERFDVMICDIQMPHMDGRELCRHLAASGPYLPGCVFIVTSRSEEQERSWVEGYPGIVLVEKPVSPKQLLRRVTRRLETEEPPHEEQRAA